MQTSISYAHEIMGKNFLGLVEAATFFGVAPSPAMVALSKNIPFSEGRLEACSETHVLVAVPLISILDLRNIMPERFYDSEKWYNASLFAKRRGDQASWHLLRKKPVENSSGKTWLRQRSLLGKDETVPSARVVVYTMIGHYLNTGEELFDRGYVRCAEVAPQGVHVRVGAFACPGIGLYVSIPLGLRPHRIELVSAKKSDEEMA